MRFSEAEYSQAEQSLQINGLVVIENFLSSEDTIKLQGTVEDLLQPGLNAGFANYATLSPVISATAAEFHHPFAVSHLATSVVTNRGLVKLIESYVGSRIKIHSSIFQKTFPSDKKPALDWHVDCGSNKQLNGTRRFAERRLRSILYLSDVKDGGLGYILDTRDAKNDFLAQPEGMLFPTDKVPVDPDRRVEVLAPKGTLILFDTHGLHRPSPLKSPRLVMNVWFCGVDFPAQLPPVLLQPANLPPDAADILYIFSTAKDFQGRVPTAAPQSSLLKSTLMRIFR